MGVNCIKRTETFAERRFGFRGASVEVDDRMVIAGLSRPPRRVGTNPRAVKVPRYRVHIGDVIRGDFQSVGCGGDGGRGVVGARRETRSVEVAGMQSHFVELFEFRHVAGLDVGVDIPLFEEVTRLGNGFDFNRAVLKVNAVPRQRPWGDRVDAHQAG